MITIVYASQATGPMSDEALTALLETARARNSSLGISGLLIYAYASFLQQIEGEAAAVDAVYASIERDPRHRNLRLLGRREVAERRFTGWSMGFEHPDADALSHRLPGFRFGFASPLVSSDLIANLTIADTVLAAAGDSPLVNAL